MTSFLLFLYSFLWIKTNINFLVLYEYEKLGISRTWSGSNILTNWWQFISRDIKNIATICRQCQEKLPSQAAEPERPHEEALYPFQLLHMDLATYKGQQFVILIDQFSSFPHV